MSKALFIIDSLGSGGAQRQLANLALGLHGEACEVEFFVYYPEHNYFEPVLEAAGVKIHKYTKRGRYSPSVLFALICLIDREQYSFCLSFLDTPNFYCEFASLLSRQFPPLIVSERNSYPAGGPSLQKRVLEQFHRLAQRVSVNSHDQARRMIQVHPWLETRLSIIYNGVDLGLFRSLGLPPIHDRVFLSVGSVISRKNPLGLALALVEYVRMFGDPPTIHWLGAIYEDAVSSEYEKVNRVLTAHHLEDHWRWLGESHDLHLLYPQYSALVHPSLREGLPNVVCEAMACGLPVLAGRIGEQPRLITPGVQGLLFDPKSPTDLAGAMYAFLQLEGKQRRDMGMEARAFAEREFGYEVYVNRYKSLFQSLFAS